MLNKTRMYRREVEGSRPFPFISSAISAGAKWIINLAKENTEYEKYSPFNSIIIQNNSTEIISLWVNGERETYIQAGSVFTLEDRWLDSLEIKNEDGSNATSANEIIVTVQRKPLDTSSALRKKFGWLFT